MGFIYYLYMVYVCTGCDFVQLKLYCFCKTFFLEAFVYVKTNLCCFKSASSQPGKDQGFQLCKTATCLLKSGWMVCAHSDHWSKVLMSSAVMAFSWQKAAASLQNLSHLSKMSHGTHGTNIYFEIWAMNSYDILANRCIWNKLFYTLKLLDFTRWILHVAMKI